MSGQMNMDELFGDGVAVPGEPHLACVLLLDVSGSMRFSGAINSLNEALVRFKEQVCKDEIARKRVDVAIVTFSTNVMVENDFAPVGMMETNTLQAEGMTCMAEGVQVAIDLVKARNRAYESLGTPFFKPWIFMITDGAPTDTDNIEAAAARVRLEESKGKLKFWALGVDGYEKEHLFKLTDRVFELNEHNFTGVFDWLSESMVEIANSSVGLERDYDGDLLPATRRVTE